MQPQRLIIRPMDTDDHRGWPVGRRDEVAPLRDALAATGEHHRLGWILGEVHRDLPPAVVLERVSDKLSGGGRHPRLPFCCLVEREHGAGASDAARFYRCHRCAAAAGPSPVSGHRRGWTNGRNGSNLAVDAAPRSKPNATWLVQPVVCGRSTTTTRQSMFSSII